VISTAVSSGDLEVAPPPREIRPDGTRDPVPEPPVTKSQNPLETVERIIKNSNVVGDKLAKTDTGTETRKTQETILKDIQSLIDQQENPPPPQKDQNEDMKKNQKDDQTNEKDKKNDTMPMTDMDDKPKQKKDMQPDSGMDQPPMNGSDQPKGRKPRQQNGDKSKEHEDQPKNAGKNSGEKGQSKDPGMASEKPKNGGGQVPGPKSKTEKQPTLPSLPPEEATVKDVWGYLPDKLRQQAMQYYKQEFTPRYAKLLESYYSSLAEKKSK
jgi:hypothetical protein